MSHSAEYGFESLVQRQAGIGDIPGLPHLSTGQKAVAVRVCAHLSRDDVLFTSHRGHAQFELIPFANVQTLAAALELVQGANAKNGGIIIDLWPAVKLGIPYAEVARIPSRYLGGIELNDGLLTSSMELQETINHRQLCGEGEFDVRGFVTTMLAAGYDGPWGIEVLNGKIRDWRLEQLTQRVAATTRAQFPS